MEKIKELIIEVAKYGFSALLALLGVGLIYLGSIGEAKIPESYWMGALILLASIIYMIFEFVLKFKKINDTGKKLENILIATQKNNELQEIKNELERENLAWQNKK